jgi:hypothetical protein
MSKEVELPPLSERAKEKCAYYNYALAYQERSASLRESLAKIAELTNDREILIYIITGIRRQIGLPDQSHPADVMRCTAAGAEVQHLFATLTAQVEESDKKLADVVFIYECENCRWIGNPHNLEQKCRNCGGVYIRVATSREGERAIVQFSNWMECERHREEKAEAELAALQQSARINHDERKQEIEHFQSELAALRSWMRQLTVSMSNREWADSLTTDSDSASFEEQNAAVHSELAALREGGSGLIGAERQRQISGEGWAPEHDDEHFMGEMVGAALCYAGRALEIISNDEIGGADAGLDWPWDIEWWKPSDDPIRNLVKAGALIAAEIDRITRERILDATVYPK